MPHMAGQKRQMVGITLRITNLQVRVPARARLVAVAVRAEGAAAA
jgi:hypothetical protein